jgi:hypothetical protein
MCKLHQWTQTSPEVKHGGAVTVLPSMSPMASYEVSFTFVLDGRSSHNEVSTSTGHHEYRKTYQANVNVSNGTQTHDPRAWP